MSGLVKTNLFEWQYLFAPDAIDVATNKIMESTQAHQIQMRQDYLTGVDRSLVSEELTREVLTRDAGLSRDIISAGFSEIENALAQVSDVFRNGLDHLGNAISDLRTSFDWAAEKVIWHLATINQKISQPLDTLGANYRKHGIYAYNNGWYEDAIKDLRQAEKYNRYDFVIHQYCGDALRKLYQYTDAYDCYQKAAQYAKPQSKQAASWALLHAALVKYLEGDFMSALCLAHDAKELWPSAEAYYQLGHYVSLVSKNDPTFSSWAVQSLETAIKKDPAYFLKIDKNQQTFESDYEEVLEPIDALKTKLLQEAREEADVKIEQCRDGLTHLQERNLDSLSPKTEAAYEKVRQTFDNAVMSFNRRSFLDYKVAIELCE